MMKLRPAAPLLLLAFAAACATTPAAVEPPPRRAILISLDALSEERVRALPPDVAPHLQALFVEGACAAYAIPSFPSVTAAGHAAISTGVWGDVNGVSANTQPMLPRDRHRLTDTESGYSAGPLRAEPIWITAALAGLDVVSHHFTQAPQPPGYRPITTADGDPFADARRRAEHALALPGMAALNGYNRVFSRGVVVNHRMAPPRPATGWTGLELLPPGSLPPLEAAWQVLEDSVFALFYGAGRYTHARVSLSRDAGAAVEVVAATADTTPLRSRPLARHFSEPLELASEGGRVFLRARLFELAPDGSAFLMFHPGLGIVETNRPDIDAEYDAAVAGWAGNGAFLMGPNGFGASLADGGDGTAEARYLETLEYATRQFMAGAEWGWRHRRADLLVDYFPVGDEIDHNMYGWLTPATPGYDPALAARYARYRNRAWEMVDMRLGHLRQLVEGDAGAAIFVIGDHGMRPYWRTFRPNIALQQAGLQVLRADGTVDLGRTRAYSPTGTWVAVNHTGWLDGIVPPDSVAAVMAAAEAALLAARSPDGQPIVTRIWRADSPAGAELGLGGAVGGELYFELTEGYYYSRQPTGQLSAAGRPNAGHGYPSVAPDMHTALCGWGPAFPPRRSAGARIIDAAPTIAEWLGMPPPLHADGRSLLGEWLRP
jgi:hypothetical protein